MVPQTMENFKLKKRRTDVNVLDAISKGASGGMKIGLNIVAMLIAEYTEKYNKKLLAYLTEKCVPRAGKKE